MNKLIYLPILFWVNFSTAQTHFRSLSEATTYDERYFSGNVVLTSKVMVSDIRIQADGRNLYSLSLGYPLRLKKEKEVMLSLMPGVAVSSQNGQLFYSGAIMCRKEEEGVEFSVYAKGMRSVAGEDKARFLAEGEILFPIHYFKFGPSISVETEKYKTTFAGSEAIRWDGLSLFGVRSCFQPQGWKEASLTLFLGWRTFIPEGKTFTAFIEEKYLKKESGPVISIGVILKFISQKN